VAKAIVAEVAVAETVVVVTAEGILVIVLMIIAADPLLAIVTTMIGIPVVGRHPRVIAVDVPDRGLDLHQDMTAAAEVLVVGITTMIVVVTVGVMMIIGEIEVIVGIEEAIVVIVVVIVLEGKIPWAQIHLQY
jgi:hypothetical protein